jgi:hypothetical protein
VLTHIPTSSHPHILTSSQPHGTSSRSSTNSTTHSPVPLRHTTNFNMSVDHGFIEELLAPLKTNGGGILGLTQSMPDDAEFIMVNPNPDVEGVPGSGPKDVSGRERRQPPLPTCTTPSLDLQF